MVNIKPGGARLGLDAYQSYLEHFVAGAIGSDSTQYSSVATVGTTPVTVIDQLVDPGYNLNNRELEAHFVHRFVGLNGSVGGSLTYYWQARSEAMVPSSGFAAVYEGSYTNLAGTYVIAVGTLLTITPTLSGYIARASLPYAPIRVQLIAKASSAANISVEVKNISYVRMTGIVIPIR